MTPVTPIPDGSVIITPTEVYRELRATHDSVRAVEMKLDAIVTDHGDAIEDHETRIRVLEKARWPLPSLAALTGVAALGLTVWQSAGR